MSLPLALSACARAFVHPSVARLSVCVCVCVCVCVRARRARHPSSPTATAIELLTAGGAACHPSASLSLPWASWLRERAPHSPRTLQRQLLWTRRQLVAAALARFETTNVGAKAVAQHARPALKLNSTSEAHTPPATTKSALRGRLSARSPCQRLATAFGRQGRAAQPRAARAARHAFHQPPRPHAPAPARRTPGHKPRTRRSRSAAVGTLHGVVVPQTHRRRWRAPLFKDPGRARALARHA